MPDLRIERINLAKDGSFPLERAMDLTASSGIPALYGVSSYTSRFEWWHHFARGIAFKERDTDAMSAGKYLEAGIAAYAADRLGEPVQKVRQYYRAPDLRIGATPDYRTAKGHRPLEIKFCAHWTSWRDRWAEGNECPLEYQLQTITQMGLMGCRTAGHVAVLFGAEITIFDVPWSDEVWTSIVEHAAEFWRSIDENRPPDPDEAEPEDVFWAFARSRLSNPIDLSGDNEVPGIVARLAEVDAAAKVAKATLKPIEEEQKALKAKLLGRIGDHDGGTLPGLVIAAPTIERAEYVAKATAYRQIKVIDENAKAKGRAKEAA
ncbi:MAG: YqaJ viral recombinase family protein [Gemmatimonadota bacterium]